MSTAGSPGSEGGPGSPGREADERRIQMLDGWEQAAPGWGRMADRVRDWGMPVSAWLVEHLDLQRGERVLELAAGPGDTGFMAAELVQPGGVLISSDASAGMLAVARERAAAAGVRGVEFAQLQLEWIDLPTASVDAVLCRWGVMLLVDPAAALSEIRRVLRPGGRCALAVWDLAERNPWATLPGRALVELGLAPPPDPAGPGMFALAAGGRLATLLEGAGFVEVELDGVDLERRYDGVEAYLEECHECSTIFARAWSALDAAQRAALQDRVAALCEPYQRADGTLRLPARSLVTLGGA